MTLQQRRRWVLVVGIPPVFQLGFLTSEWQAQQRAARGTIA
jgi:hypothetical protein